MNSQVRKNRKKFANSIDLGILKMGGKIVLAEKLAVKMGS